MTNGIELFGPLAEDYSRYRPGYPAGLVDELVRLCSLTGDWVIGCLNRWTAEERSVGYEPQVIRNTKRMGEGISNRGAVAQILIRSSSLLRYRLRRTQPPRPSTANG